LELGSGSGIIVPSSVFFPSPAAALGVTRINPDVFQSRRITSILILRHIQVLGSSCFSNCELLLSISFEADSELRRIESNAFLSCSYLKSIIIPCHVQIICSSCCVHCDSLSSISFESDSVYRIECIFLWLVSRINHNSSYCSNSLFIMLCRLHITFINFIWNGFGIDTHRIECILWLLFSQINHNSWECWVYRWFCIFKCFQCCDFNWVRQFTFCYSIKFHSGFIEQTIDSIFWDWIEYFHSSSHSNSLFIMLCRVQLTFINCIWKWLGVEVHRIECIFLLLSSQVNYNSSSCSHSLFIVLFKLQITFIWK
jgi:hypothetical protein